MVLAKGAEEAGREEEEEGRPPRTSAAVLGVRPKQVVHTMPGLLLGRLGLWTGIPRHAGGRSCQCGEMVNLQTLRDVQEEKSDKQLDIWAWSLGEGSQLETEM